MENFFKKIKFNLTLSRIVIASIIVFLLFYFWGLIFQTKDTVKHVQEQKIQEIKDKNNEKHFRKTFEFGSSELSKNEIDSLKKVIEAKNSEIALKNVEILSITKLNASIRDTLKDFKLERDELNNKVWKFQKIYEDGTKTSITMFEKDTTAVQDTDLKVVVTDFSAKEKGKRNFFVDVASQNDNFKLNGSKVLRIKVKEPKDLFQVNWATSYFKGIGNEMNFATSEIQVWVLPDGGFVPKFGSGLVWFLNDGKIYPFYKVGVDIRLKSVQK